MSIIRVNMRINMYKLNTVASEIGDGQLLYMCTSVLKFLFKYKWET